MTWLQTYSGRVYDYERPDVRAIDLVDIAHALSQQCRFAGHCKRFYSVAEHSVHVLNRVRELDGKGPTATNGPKGLDLLRFAIMHDAHEAYVCDLPAPLKWVGVPGYDRLEHIAKGAVAERFGLFREKPDHVAQADLELLATEARQIMAEPPRDWNLPYPPLEVDLPCWRPLQAFRAFLSHARSVHLIDEAEFYKVAFG